MDHAHIDYVPAKQVAHLLGISTRTLENWRCSVKNFKKQRPKYITLPNGRAMYPSAELAEYMANHPRLANLLDFVSQSHPNPQGETK